MPGQGDAFGFVVSSPPPQSGANASLRGGSSRPLTAACRPCVTSLDLRLMFTLCTIQHIRRARGSSSENRPPARSVYATASSCSHRSALHAGRIRSRRKTASTDFPSSPRPAPHPTVIRRLPGLRRPVAIAQSISARDARPDLTTVANEPRARSWRKSTMTVCKIAPNLLVAIAHLGSVCKSIMLISLNSGCPVGDANKNQGDEAGSGHHCRARRARHI